MAASEIQVAVITPEGAAFEGAARKVVAPAFDGEVAFYPGHAPYVGQLGSGELRVEDTSGSTSKFFISGGVVEVHDNEVSVLAEQVAPLASLDVSEEAKALAEILASPTTSAEEVEARLQAAEAQRAKLRVAKTQG